MAWEERKPSRLGEGKSDIGCYASQELPCTQHTGERHTLTSTGVKRGATVPEELQHTLH